MTGVDLLKMMTRKHDSQEFNTVVVKADVQGSPLQMDSPRLVDTHDAINWRVIGSGVGNINESDIRLADSSQAIVYGFNIDLLPAVKRFAMRDRVQVRLFKVIYELPDDARQSMEQMLEPMLLRRRSAYLT